MTADRHLCRMPSGFLFEREEIPPEVLRNIMLYCLDCYSSEGVPGKSGTSCAAMMFLSNWLNSMGDLGILPVKSRYLSGKEVYLGNESYVNDALRRGGAVVLRLFSDEWHYVLLTGEDGEHVYMFDPYYDQEGYGLDDIQIVENCPTRYNRIVPWKYFNKIALNVYSLGPYQGGRQSSFLIRTQSLRLRKPSNILFKSAIDKS